MKYFVFIGLFTITVQMGFAQTAQKGAGSVTPGAYSCAFFISGHLQKVPGFEIKPGGVYLDENGKAGKYSYDPAESLVTFKGGSRDGQAARFEAGDGKRAVLRIYNERRSRTVSDCETAGK